MIRIDVELVKKAKEMGLNVSKLCENILVQAVKTLEKAFIEKGVEAVGFSLEPRAGFEPATLALPSETSSGFLHFQQPND